MEQFQILWVARSYTMPEAGVKEHTHPFYHMFYVSEGGCSFIIENESYSLNKGDCILVPKNKSHSFFNYHKETAEYIEIKFAAKSGSKMAIPDEVFLIKDNKLIGYLMKRTLREYLSFGISADEAVESYLETALFVMTEEKRANKNHSYEYIDASGYSDISQEIVKYLEAHYSEDISLDSISEALGYNKSYLCVAFKKETGTTILDCLNMIRIRRAAELIAYSDHTIAQVSSLCGFRAVSHFNSVFSKYVGTTPGQIRRAYPGDILIGPADKKQDLINRPGRFMYSVLARKRFSPDEIIAFEHKDKN